MCTVDDTSVELHSRTQWAMRELVKVADVWIALAQRFTQEQAVAGVAKLA